jgi:hypothetical protein
MVQNPQQPHNGPSGAERNWDFDDFGGKIVPSTEGPQNSSANT